MLWPRVVPHVKIPGQEPSCHEKGLFQKQPQQHSIVPKFVVDVPRGWYERLMRCLWSDVGKEGVVFCNLFLNPRHGKIAHNSRRVIVFGPVPRSVGDARSSVMGREFLAREKSHTTQQLILSSHSTSHRYYLSNKGQQCTTTERRKPCTSVTHLEQCSLHPRWQARRQSPAERILLEGNCSDTFRTFPPCTQLLHSGTYRNVHTPDKQPHSHIGDMPTKHIASNHYQQFTDLANVKLFTLVSLMCMHVSSRFGLPTSLRLWK